MTQDRMERDPSSGEVEEIDAEVLGALMAGLAPCEPSSAVRRRILEAVAGQRPHAAGHGPGAAGPGGAGDDGGQAAEVIRPAPGADGRAVTAGEEAAAVVPLRRARGTSVWMRAAASVVILAAGIGIGTAVGMRIGHSSAMESMADTEHYAHLNRAQDVQRLTDTMPDGHIATLTWSDDMDMTALSLPEEMMAAAQGHSLQVWLTKGGRTSSLGLYDPQSGAGFTFLDLMPEDGETIFITSEPQGGSAQPTGEALVTFDVHPDGSTSRRPEPTPTTHGDSQT